MRSDPIKSAARTLEIFELFHEHRRPLRLVYVCERLSYPQSSTTALLKSLVILGYLNYDLRSRTYFPTPKVATIGDWINHSLYGQSNVLQLVREVCDETEEVAALCSQNDIFVQNVRIIEPANDFKIPPREGTMRLLTHSTAGLALLSEMSAKAVDKIVRHTNAYIGGSGERVDGENLERHLRWIRKEGYSFLAGTPLPEAAAVAVMLPSVGHSIPMALGVGGLKGRVVRKKNEIVASLRKAQAAYKAELFTSTATQEDPDGASEVAAHH